MLKRLSPKRFLKAEGGVAAVEFALIFPFMLGVYFGLIDLTGLISFNRKVTAVASATADLVGQNRASVLKTDINDYFKITGMIMKPTPDSQVKVRVYGYRKVGTNVVKQWVVDNGKGTGCSAEPVTTTMASLMVAGNDLIVAQACMTYYPYIGSFMGENILSHATFNVEQIITLRPRSTLTVDCYLATVGSTKCPAA